MFDVFTAIATALPVVTSFLTKEEKPQTKTESALGFLSAGAKAFVKSQGINNDDGVYRPFGAAPDARPRSVGELTRTYVSPAQGAASAGISQGLSGYNNPDIRTALANLQNARNDQVRALFSEYSVAPTVAQGRRTASLERPELT